MNDKEKKEQLLSAYILLYGSLFLSQNFMWRIISLISSINDDFSVKMFRLFQAQLAVFYILFSILSTDDMLILHMLFNKRPFIYKCIDFIITHLLGFIIIVSLFIMSLLSLSLFYKTDKDAEKQLALKTKQTTNNIIQLFSTLPIEPRLYCGLSYFCLILITVDCFMDAIFYFDSGRYNELFSYTNWLSVYC